MSTLIYTPKLFLFTRNNNKKLICEFIWEKNKFKTDIVGYSIWEYLF